MKRASYRAGVVWIARNDEPGSSDALDDSVVSGYISVSLLADLFDKDPGDVARSVIRYRELCELDKDYLDLDEAERG